MTNPLPREMQPHTYAIMREVEDQHWWYVGTETNYHFFR